MSDKPLPRVLLIVESCNPDWSSVPLVGYNFYRAASEIATVTLVTHDRNRQALLNRHPDDTIIFIEPKASEHRYYRLVEKLTTFKGRVVWPLYHVLAYPLYSFFDKTVREQFAARVQAGEFDLVHSLTPMMPRYPVALSKDCGATPFILGPVNGGVPFPEAFTSRGRREFSQFNFFRNIGRWIIPNYEKTYHRADKVLAGSVYTKNWIQQALGVADHKCQLMFENAVPKEFYQGGSHKITSPDNPLKIVFSGRLVPYKGCDMLIRAMAKLKDEGVFATLTIVGDGAETTALKDLVNALNLQMLVTFTGWVEQEKTREYYRAADVFGFPSVREFGGAVVMEAMACGLPCVVVDNGGIGEYVNADCGVKIAPNGEAYVIEQLAEALKNYANDRTLLHQHATNAYQRAADFSWPAKTQELKAVYRQVLEK